jgi:hypothetical protein
MKNANHSFQRTVFGGRGIQTLCMKGILRMASGSRSGNRAVSHVVVRRHCRSARLEAGIPSLTKPSFAICGSAKAKVGAPAAVSCTTRRSSGRASGKPLI